MKKSNCFFNHRDGSVIVNHRDGSVIESMSVTDNHRDDSDGIKLRLPPVGKLSA